MVGGKQFVQAAVMLLDGIILHFIQLFWSSYHSSGLTWLTYLLECLLKFWT
uniref:Uncharacterized protein n=1 Tax=Rhizophora mucronata TaxID=61149 RepID=A0A2P2P0W5_RHIMU